MFLFGPIGTVRCRIFVFALLSVGVAGFSSGAWAQSCGAGSSGACFQGLGFLPGSVQSSVANAISGDGSAVVGTAKNANGDSEAFRWKGAGLAGLGFIGSNDDGSLASFATSSNNDGSNIVGWGSAPSDVHVAGMSKNLFRWSNGVMSVLECYAGDANPAIAFVGDVVAGACYHETEPNIFNHQVFRWDAGAFTFMPPLPGYDDGGALGVSGDGSLVVGFSQSFDTSRDQATQWQNHADPTSMGFLPGCTAATCDSHALAVNSDGTVVVGYSTNTSGERHAVRWVHANISDLGLIQGCRSSTGRAVSGDGSVVVGDCDGSAFRWTADTGMQYVRTLLIQQGVTSVTNWGLGTAMGVSLDGITIVGGPGTIDNNNKQQAWLARLPLPAGTASSILAAVLPTARSVTVGTPATAFASVINTSSHSVSGCQIAMPSDVPGTFQYRATDSNHNFTAPLNTPVSVNAGAVQDFVFGVTPSAEINSDDIALVFSCTGAIAPKVSGLNTFLLSASNAPVPDLVSISATPTNDGIANVPGTNGTGIFAASTINIGAAAQITATVDDNGANLPLTLTICRTDPQSSQCTNPSTPGSSSTFTLNNNEIATFTAFVQGRGTVPFDPANNRLFLRFKTGDGVTRGATSVAVRTQ